MDDDGIDGRVSESRGELVSNAPHDGLVRPVAPPLPTGGPGDVLRPVMFVDYDGVLNVFPPDKVQRRGGVGSTDWMKDEVMIRTFSDDNAFRPDARRRTVVTDGGGYRMRISVRWSTELAGLIDADVTAGLADYVWLSTWQPYTERLERWMGWDPTRYRTAVWYDAGTSAGIWTGKYDTVRDQVRADTLTGVTRPIVWVDDEEADGTAAMRLQQLVDPKLTPMLMIQPDARIGISRPQWRRIHEFITDPSTRRGGVERLAAGARTGTGHLGY